LALKGFFNDIKLSNMSNNFS